MCEQLSHAIGPGALAFGIRLSKWRWRCSAKSDTREACARAAQRVARQPRRTDRVMSGQNTITLPEITWHTQAPNCLPASDVVDQVRPAQLGVRLPRA